MYVHVHVCVCLEPVDGAQADLNLLAGDYFGERALLKDEVRRASAATAVVAAATAAAFVIFSCVSSSVRARCVFVCVDVSALVPLR